VVYLTICPIPNFADYRYDVIFKAYKWDLQAGDQSTISDHALLLDNSDANFLANAAQQLYIETVNLECALKQRPDLAVKMGISEQMADKLHSCTYNAEKHIRFMRFDFHPTEDGWVLSEVNSDVPAGYPEASILPTITEQYLPGYTPYGNFGEVLTQRLTCHLPQGGTVAYVHDTHIVEDYQIFRFLGDILDAKGYRSLYLAPNNMQWEGTRAGGIDAIMRYYPVEWMECTPDIEWTRFLNTDTPSCNHPIALLTQSKRLPLVWDELDVDLPAWKKFLPQTVCPLVQPNMDGWIFKPAFGRVGEGINVPGVVSADENRDITVSAVTQPEQWVAQKMFRSKPVSGKHVCIGVFVIDGTFAGFYGRTADCPRIDENAADTPVLLKNQ